MNMYLKIVTHLISLKGRNFAKVHRRIVDYNPEWRPYSQPYSLGLSSLPPQALVHLLKVTRELQHLPRYYNNVLLVHIVSSSHERQHNGHTHHQHHHHHVTGATELPLAPRFCDWNRLTCNSNADCPKECIRGCKNFDNGERRCWPKVWCGEVDSKKGVALSCIRI